MLLIAAHTLELYRRVAPWSSWNLRHRKSTSKAAAAAAATTLAAEAEARDEIQEWCTSSRDEARAREGVDVGVGMVFFTERGSDNEGEGLCSKSHTHNTAWHAMSRHHSASTTRRHPTQHDRGPAWAIIPSSYMRAQLIGALQHATQIETVVDSKDPVSCVSCIQRSTSPYLGDVERGREKPRNSYGRSERKVTRRPRRAEGTPRVGTAAAVEAQD